MPAVTDAAMTSSSRTCKTCRMRQACAAGARGVNQETEMPDDIAARINTWLARNPDPGADPFPGMAEAGLFAPPQATPRSHR